MSRAVDKLSIHPSILSNDPDLSEITVAESKFPSRASREAPRQTTGRRSMNGGFSREITSAINYEVPRSRRSNEDNDNDDDDSRRSWRRHEHEGRWRTRR